MKQPILNLLLALLTLAMLTTQTVEARDRDPLAPVFSMKAVPFEAFPPDLVAPQNAEAITALVNEARLFGVPVAVRVVSVAEGHPRLPQLADQDPAARVPDEVMRDMAQRWMGEEPIESAPGAEDGFLMLVVIPEDPTLSTAVIEPGPNGLPLNGLTRANIDEVMQTLVLPSFENNEVSQGIRNGLSVFSYNNLFGKPERIELDDLHTDLQLVAGVPLAGATALGAAGLLGLAAWIRRRGKALPAPGESLAMSPFEAAALHEGRVNDAVVTGGLLELMRRGVVTNDDHGLRVDERRAGAIADPLLGDIVAILRRNAGPDGRIGMSSVRRLHDLMGPARKNLEDRLAAHGLYNRDGRVELAWLLLASGLVAGIALFTLLPSILGMARFGIIAIILAILAITVVLTWGMRRSWTTPRGREAMEAWRGSASVEERVAFDTIVHQDDLISSVGGPFTPATVVLVRSLRGLGAT